MSDATFDLSSFDLTYDFDDTLRPIPNNSTQMEQAIQYLLEAASVPQVSILAKLRYLGMAGIYQAMLGDPESGEAWVRDALKLANALDDMRQQIVMRLRLGQILQWQTRYTESNQVFDTAIAQCRINDQLSDYLDFALQHSGKNKFDQKYYAEAEADFIKALSIRQDKADPDLIASTQHALKITRALLSRPK